MLTRRFLILAAVAGIGLGANHGAVAQPYPSNVIKLIVPFNAGSQPDTIARLIGQQLSARVGPVVIENRPSAGGIVGMQVAAGAPPDGHTLVLGTVGSLAIGPALLKSPGYDATKSFAPVALVSSAPLVLVVGPDVPAKAVQELIAHAKANPGKLNYGGANATPPDLACDLFRRAAAIDIVHIGYRVTPQRMADLLSGQIQIVCEATTILLPLIQAGKVKPLVVMSSERLPELPDVPTVAEIGLPDLLVSAWAGILVPAGTPQSIVDKLNTAINEGLKSPDMQASLAKLGNRPTIGTPQDFGNHIAAETRRWADVVNESGAKLD
jgi:tripartite-type tricarboxylate transporter receptor subunit TctC